jgi:hypothetical protein
MPRSLSIPLQAYPINEDGTPKTYQFSIDGITNANTDWIQLTLTNLNAWPAAQPIISGNLIWSTGAGSGILINSPFRNSRGEYPDTWTGRFNIPTIWGADNKPHHANATHATATMTLHAPIVTAITVVPGTN